MTGTGPGVTASLSQQNWEFLFQQTLLFASYQISRLTWRGAPCGPLPNGYDANSLAAEAFLEFFRAEHSNPHRGPNLTPPLDEILYELRGLVLRIASRLHHRKENFILSNVDDLCPVQIDDGHFINPIELIPDLSPAPDYALLEKESLLLFESSRSRFSSFLKPERRLANLFQLLCDGVETPQALARKLKLRRGTVTNLRKQLRRRWASVFPRAPTAR
jgi:hypothetical protein